jgi:hypothetical protein
LVFNSEGDLFVAAGGHDIYEFINNNGTLSSSPVIFASGLDEPYGLAFNSAGNLFVADNGNGEITEITPAGTQSTFASGLKHPTGLAFNGEGDLFVLVYTNNSPLKGGPLGYGAIIEITPGGTQSTYASTGTNADIGLVSEGLVDLFVANSVPDGSITEYTLDGPFTYATGLKYPYFMVFDSAGDLFVGIADADNYSIVEITPGGTQSVFTTAVNIPEGLAFQPAPALQAIDVGIQTDQFGFTLIGSNNEVVVVQACTNLANPVWLPQATNTLTNGSSYFSDPQWTNYPTRYYRLLSP